MRKYYMVPPYAEKTYAGKLARVLMELDYHPDKGVFTWREGVQLPIIGALDGEPMLTKQKDENSWPFMKIFRETFYLPTLVYAAHADLVAASFRPKDGNYANAQFDNLVCLTEAPSAIPGVIWEYRGA